MDKKIPTPLIAVCAEIAARRESHPTLNGLFMYAEASGDPPPGSKPAKALEWLRNTNKDKSAKPLDVLGKIIENYMEQQLNPIDPLYEIGTADREKIRKTLEHCELQYVKGGKIIGALSAPSQNLEVFIREMSVVEIENEFNRALENVEKNPREAVSAASNILESLCKIYISDESLEMPAKQDLRPIWSVVRKHLRFDPSQLEDQDLQMIISGIISIVEGIGSLRTHASSAHGAGRKSYTLEPRHARLAIHAAHTVTLFVLETWEKNKKSK